MPEPETAAALLAEARARLSEAGVPDAALDARLLVADALGVEPAMLPAIGERPVDATGRARARAHLEARAAGRPVGRILGRRAFWTLDLALSPGTLEPRPDTETLVEAVLAFLGAPGRGRDAPLTIADLGTGTGAILLALLSELPRARGVGTDLDRDALATARANACRNGLDDRALFARGDFFGPVAPGVDVIVSNPPYIPSIEVDDLAPEVREHDPRLALDGGADGLDCYRTILRQVSSAVPAAGGHWRPDVFLELSPSIAEPLGVLAVEAGFEVADWRRDLAGRFRCVHLRWRK